MKLGQRQRAAGNVLEEPLIAAGGSLYQHKCGKTPR